MSETLTFISVFFIGGLAGTIGSMVGGGGLIAIPFLIFIGLPPQIAIATDRFGSVGQALTAFYKFWKAKKIVWKFVPVLVICSIIGALIGANILIRVDSDFLENIIGIILLILLPLVFINRDIGTKRRKMSKPKMALGIFIYLLIQIFAGFFGGGTGPMIFYALVTFFGLTIIESNASNTLPWIILSITTLIIFAIHGLVDYKIGIVLLAGMATGGYIGAYFALKKGDIWIKRLFAIAVIIASLKLLFF